MAMVLFKNENTGEMKEVKLGFSWTILFFGTFFGIPFFLRKLYAIGAAIIVANLVYGAVMQYTFESGDLGLASSFYLGYTVANVVLAFIGNKLGAKKLVELGFKIVEKDETRRSFIKAKWELSDNAFLDNN